MATVLVLVATSLWMPALRPPLPAQLSSLQSLGLTPLPIVKATYRAKATYRVALAPHMMLATASLGAPQRAARFVVLLVARCVGFVASLLSAVGYRILALETWADDWKTDLLDAGDWLAGKPTRSPTEIIEED